MRKPSPRPAAYPFQAVILDMDGVMVDSEHQWMLAEIPFLKGLVGRWRVADHRKVVGLGVVDLYYHLVREYGLRLNRKDFLERCELLAREVYRREVSLAPGLRGFIRDLRRRRVPLGLASSSPRTWVDMVLRRFRLASGFAAVVTGDDAPGRTKPAPDLYLLAARRLKVRPRSCLAVEDSDFGVRAAKDAGMTCVGLRSGHNNEQGLAGADWEARGFAALGYRSVISRLKAAWALTKAPQPASRA
ncbi:MAG: HAD family phosphatase [Elusimicrobia bacterium]|nr:HAD family phosphatase [Elusimicrobiota bacterium]